MTNPDDGYTGTNFNRPGVQEGFELVKQGLVGCWIVDKEAVRHIFDLSIAGKGPTQIARILEQEKVLTISAYYAKNPEQNKHLKEPEDPYRWCGDSIMSVLEHIEYTGCTCNFKTYSKSYKLKKRFPNTVEDMVIFPDTQEAIISQAQWDRVQELRKNKRRNTKAERQGLFSGLLFCTDCGSKLHFSTSKNFEGRQDHYVCSSYKSNRGDCSAHYIREDVLRELVLERIKAVMSIFEKMLMVFRRSGCNATVKPRRKASRLTRSVWNKRRNAFRI